MTETTFDVAAILDSVWANQARRAEASGAEPAHLSRALSRRPAAE
jgi:hypothetical protein